MQPVIRFENVGKLYRLGTVGTGTLSHDLRRWWITSVMRREDPYLKIGETNDRSTKGSSDYVYALRDINLEVQEGDVLGIIGKNGAGKSTLLKLLSRVTAPTTGKIYTKGRIASLLEVGTGFHPELTGRENIYMNGCILGMKRWEIDKKLDEIVDFSGCERYIDTPVKRYSSGMMVRLGFAVAAHLDPEILVVDEVLAVGDAEFQKKAIGKMQDVSKGEGRTVLFVSHNMASVRQLCNSGILLENGKITFAGTAVDTVSQYMASSGEQETSREFSRNDAPGTHDLKLRKIYFIDDAGNKIDYGVISQRIGICVEYEVMCIVAAFTHGANIFDAVGNHIFTTHDNNPMRNTTIEPGLYRTCLWVPANLMQNGSYFLTFAFMRYNPFEILYHSDTLIRLNIVDDMDAATRNAMYKHNLPGLIRPIIEWEQTEKLI